ncbi:MAG: type II secretion system protein GspC, partial [Persicimonas sp.]
RCLFGCPDEQPADECEGGCEEGEECRKGQCVEIDEEPDIPSDFPVASELNLKLLGAMVSKQPDYSMALIKNEDSSETLVASVGDYLMDDVELVEIRRDRIILRRQDQMEFVRMDKSITGNPTATPASTVRRSSPPSSSSRKPKAGKPAASAKDAIRKRGDDSFEVERSAIERRIENRRELASQGRVVPNFKNGQRQGLKLVGITPNSVYSELGIQSGDVLHSVNGKQIKSSHQAMDFFESMKNEKTVKVQIERRGQKKDLEYNIR